MEYNAEFGFWMSPWKEDFMRLTYTYREAKEGRYIGFLKQYPDYRTQGDSINELEDTSEINKEKQAFACFFCLHADDDARAPKFCGIPH